MLDDVMSYLIPSNVSGIQMLHGYVCGVDVFRFAFASVITQRCDSKSRPFQIMVQNHCRPESKVNLSNFHKGFIQITKGSAGILPRELQ